MPEEDSGAGEMQQAQEVTRPSLMVSAVDGYSARSAAHGSILVARRAGSHAAISVAVVANSASSHIRKRGGATDAATASSIVTVLSIGRSGAARRISARMPSTTLPGVTVRATNDTNRRKNASRSCWNGT